ncbi:antimicrobial ginkbilobin-2-like protein [Coffea arabica]|uniref:Antimicrobial ginkbilobin-2-like protein n=1 Tax=Coffea arabica TaxID=13443 RepID=A0A6P6UFP4_COFAR|nr:cysteine-rich repeat secretory protein 38-like [Coffea arabica]
MALKLNLFLYILSIAIFAEMAAGVDLFKPVDHVCGFPDNRNFTSGSEYENNLNFILHDLSNKTPATGFGLAYAGGVENSNRAYGRAQCRADVSTADCKTCISEMVRWVRGKCPFYKSAFAWFQGCLLRYSDDDFFGKIDDPNSLAFFILEKENLSNIAPLEKVEGLLNQLAGEASASKELFARGEVKLAGSKNLYGLVQCTLDLSPADCKTCVDGLVSIVPKIYGNGTQIYTSTCTLQYLLYAFFNA